MSSVPTKTNQTILNFDNDSLISLLEGNDYQIGIAPSLNEASLPLPFTFFKEQVFIPGEGWNVTADITIRWGEYILDTAGNTTIYFAWDLTGMKYNPPTSWMKDQNEIFNFLNTLNVFLKLSNPFILNATIANFN